jgi:hypothetical protein
VKKLLKTGTAKMWARRAFKAALPIFSKYTPGDVQSMQVEEKMSRRIFAEDVFSIVDDIRSLRWLLM